MNRDELNACFREIEKLAVGLSQEDERKQMGQFAALGAASMPLVDALKNKIQHGSITKGVAMKRWLPAQMIGGALLGGAIPAARHLIERGNVEKARARREAAKELISLTPGGVNKALSEAEQTVPKVASLSPEAKRYGALTAFGAGALPVAEALTNKIRMGSFMGGASPKRWLLSQIPQALLWGAAFPAAGMGLQKLFPSSAKSSAHAAPTLTRRVVRAR